MDPYEVGAKILKGMTEQKGLILTHPEHGPDFEEIHAAVMAALPIEDAPPGRLKIEQLRRDAMKAAEAGLVIRLDDLTWFPMQPRQPSRTAWGAPRATARCTSWSKAARSSADPLAVAILGGVGAAVDGGCLVYEDDDSPAAACCASSSPPAVPLPKGNWPKRWPSAAASQLVVLGAGFDTFAYRNPFGETLRVFEVDHPATQAWKRERLAAMGIELPARLTFAGVDFERSPSPKRWRRRGSIRRSAPSSSGSAYRCTSARRRSMRRSPRWPAGRGRRDRVRLFGARARPRCPNRGAPRARRSKRGSRRLASR